MSKTLNLTPALDKPDLVSPTVLSMLSNWQGSSPAHEVLVGEIDPSLSGGSDFCTQHGINPDEGANCVVVEGTRGSSRTIAACLAPVNYKLDLNGVVRKTLNARRVSLTPLDEILEATQMEYGSITPLGLPPEWPILIDKRLTLQKHIFVGAGLVKAKLLVPLNILLEIPSLQVIENLAKL